MAKKDFKSGIDGLIQTSIKQENETAKEKKDLSGNFVKATYYFDEEQLKKIKAVAYYEREPIGKIMANAFDQFLNNYSELEQALRIFKR